MAYNQKIIDDLSQIILSGISGFEGPGLDNMDVPYNLDNPPSPQAFQAEIKKQVAGSIALSIVDYIDKNISDLVTPLITSSYNNLFAEAIKHCTVAVSNPEGQPIGTGIITFTPPEEPTLG